MGIYEKLLRIQTELKVNKGHYNDFGNFNYRSCEDIQEAVKPLLKELNVVLKIGDDIVMIGSRYYIKATAVLIDCITGETVENVAFAREEESKPKMDASQLTGSCSSYARKYALNGLFCLDDVKDADTGKTEQSGNNGGQNGNNNANRGNQNQNNQKGQGNNRNQNGKGKGGNQKQQLSDEEYKAIINELNRTGYRTGALVKHYNVGSLKELTGDKYRDAMAQLKKLPDRNNQPRAKTFKEVAGMFPPEDYAGPVGKDIV